MTSGAARLLSLAQHHLGDSWSCVDGNRVHCFFLVCPDIVPRHTTWDIGHASSEDLKSWAHHGVVLRRGAADAWAGICLATGSVLRRGGRFWMAYTGNWFGPLPAVGLAVSAELRHWQKVGSNPIATIDEVFYTGSSRGRRPFPHWHDPFLFEVEGVVPSRSRARPVCTERFRAACWRRPILDFPSEFAAYALWAMRRSTRGIATSGASLRALRPVGPGGLALPRGPSTFSLGIARPPIRTAIR